MTDDIKPYLTLAELDAVQAEIDRMVKDEADAEDAANALDGFARRLLVTARAALSGASEGAKRLDGGEFHLEYIDADHIRLRRTRSGRVHASVPQPDTQ